MNNRIRRVNAAARIAAWALLLLPAAFPGPSQALEPGMAGKYSVADGLPSDWVKGIFVDGGRLLVSAGDAVRGGTAVREEGGGKFVPFDPGSGFAGRRVTGFARFAGKVYVATESALNVSGEGRWTSLDNSGRVEHRSELLVAAEDSLYAVSRVMYGGVLRFDGKDWTPVTRGEGTGFLNNATALLARGKELFIGTTSNGLLHFDGSAWRVIGPSDGLPGVWVTAFAGAAGGGVYVGTYGGLAYLEGGKVRGIGPAEGYTGGRVTSLAIVDGILVAGTANAGIYLSDGGRFRAFGEKEGLSDNRVEALAPVPGGVWVGTLNGLNRVDLR
jgi:ligand-binding sensor domain-containing protein